MESPTLKCNPLLPTDVQIHSYQYHIQKHKKIQECIPVGCVPATHRPYAGVCFPGGVCLVQGGRGFWCAWSEGVCPVWGEVFGLGGGVPGLGGALCAWSRGSGVCLVWGVSGLGGWCAWSGGWCAWSGGIVCLVRGVHPSMH